MVKFGRLLRQECVPEWNAAYVDYAGLKKLLNACPDSPPREEDLASEDEGPEDEGGSLWPASGAGSAGNSRGGGGGGGDLSGGSSLDDGLQHTPTPGRLRRRTGRAQSTGLSAWRSLDDFFATRGRGRTTDTSSRRSGAARPLISVTWGADGTPVCTLTQPSPAVEVAQAALLAFWQRLDREVATCNTFFTQQAGFFEKRFEELLAALKRHRRAVEQARVAAGAATKRAATPPLSTVAEGAATQQPPPPQPPQRRVSTGRTMLEVSEWVDADVDAAAAAAPPRRRPLFQPADAAPPSPPPSTTDASFLTLSQAPRASSALLLRREARQLRHAMRELYRGMAMLLSFSRLNAQAIAKILKKHDKRTGFECAALYNPFCDKCSFKASEHLLVAMQRAIEREFITLDDTHSTERASGGGDSSPPAARARRERRAAVLHKLRPQMPGPPKSAVLLLAGLLTGGSAAAAAFLGLQLARTPGLTTTLAPVLRGPLLLLLNLAGHGVAVAGWSYNRISWDFIFGQTPGAGLRYDGYLCLAGALTLPWLISWCGALSAVAGDGQGGSTRMVVAPVAVLLASLLLLLAPLPRGRLRRLISWPSQENRLFFWRAALCTAAAPAVPVLFADFFIADQLVSQQQALCDLAYLLCFYASGAYARLASPASQPGTWPLDLAKGHLALPLHLACVLLPFWLRIAQCARRLRDERRALHATNIGKYALGASAAAARAVFLLSSPVGTAAGRRAAFVVCSALASAAGFLWDLRMDWGLLHRQDGPGGLLLLRANLMSGPPGLYYAAIAANLLLRCAWLISLLASRAGPVTVTTLTACLEVVRRCNWSFFRVEAEHEANTASMTAFAPIALPSAYVALRRMKARESRKAARPKAPAAGRDAPSPPDAMAEPGDSVSNRIWADTGDMLAAIGTPLRGDATRRMQAEEEGGPTPARTALAPRLNTQRFTSGEHFAWASDGEDDDGSPGDLQ